MRVIKCPRKGRARSAGKGGRRTLEKTELDEAVSVLRRGGLVVYPTDTLYALGADPFNEEALKRLFDAKKRPFDMPVSVAFASLKAASAFVILDGQVRETVDRCLPGPLTILARKREDLELSPLISRDGIVGIRVPGNPLAIKLAGRFGPVTATSANRHGGREPTRASIAVEELGDSVELYIDCGPCRIGRASSVVDVTRGEFRVLREGPVSKEQLENG